ncbi:hypothetical protein [Massilia genomosp. 1]|uniref:Uncharacterized protein n=1 Tax=Massilia genomosp. 1 TaxID=2609280 RepID=A0ABX0MZ70_9BURK|nr:hypothetical protein [Massilia genomosp. 1]NHZ65713.1 hypothetical protein [Massilia genomosp. 1]
MKIRSNGAKLVITSLALALLLAAMIVFRLQISRFYFQMIDEHPLWFSSSVPVLVLLAIFMAFIRARKKARSQ